MRRLDEHAVSRLHERRKLLFKLLINTGLGFVTLFLLNFFGDFVGITLGFNWVNALVIGVAGFPGVVLLLLIKYLF
ncbi:MAG: pro-sigmaK processing inhibitor BofA family protein [Oscillospiraceae bacterium]